MRQGRSVRGRRNWQLGERAYYAFYIVQSAVGTQLREAFTGNFT
jgi:hypothetical protein